MFMSRVHLDTVWKKTGKSCLSVMQSRVVVDILDRGATTLTVEELASFQELRSEP